MFIICFGCGLGNQMFQYAFFLAMKKSYPNVSIKMDVDNILPKDHNGFELDYVFDIQRDECSKWRSVSLSNYYPDSMPAHRLMQLMFNIHRMFNGDKISEISLIKNAAFYVESVFHQEPWKSLLFKGYWENPKYFKNVKEEVKQAFTFRNDLNDSNTRILQRIIHSNSVSIHIRRGDFSNAKFHILSIDYYKKAIKIIKEKVKDPQFFIFSDDTYNMQFIGNSISYIYVEGNKGRDSYVDMMLMSKCKHNIIANSTFSFWGAFLNNNENKVVIAPNRYRPDSEQPLADTDWILIDITKEIN